jgi:hypothetical protein
MLKEALVLAALSLGQIPSIVDGDTIRIVGTRNRLVDYETRYHLAPR